MSSYKNEPIAVIGSGCRFPGGSTSPSKLWDLLRDPRDVLRKIDRFRADNFYNTDGHHHGASNVLSAYLLAEDTKLFDTQFFNIPLSEAEAIDPQQRLLMETVYESLDTAGLSMESLSGSNTAVYVGVMCDDFSQIGKHLPSCASTGALREPEGLTACQCTATAKTCPPMPRRARPGAFSPTACPTSLTGTARP